MGAPRLLGREAEERRIGALVAAARFGRGGSLLILGEPGIGKSSLLGLTAGHPGTRELHVTGYEAESTIPYAAIYRLILPLRPHLPLLSQTHQLALRVAGERSTAHRPTASSSGWAFWPWSLRPARKHLWCARSTTHTTSTPSHWRR